MVVSFWNLLDFLAFFPPLLEHLVAHSIRINFSMGHFDFRWFKILRCAGGAAGQPPCPRQEGLGVRIAVVSLGCAKPAC